MAVLNHYHPSVTMDKMKEIYLLAALEYWDYNRTATAKALGMSLRTVRFYIANIRESGRPVPLKGRTQSKLPKRYTVVDKGLSGRE